jgi:hypothetical protein
MSAVEWVAIAALVVSSLAVVVIAGVSVLMYRADRRDRPKLFDLSPAPMVTEERSFFPPKATRIVRGGKAPR